MVKNFGGKKTKGKSRKSFNSIRTYNFEDLKKIEGQEYAFVQKSRDVFTGSVAGLF